ncbi:hypothetical protein E2C01_057132 [Portunus trituberculatus]|uniref:Uncharacterized protein n=1 Tax=Portunus trituberculatus TaxID=210409 RepID=A0A5B7GS67_PORTR|nr:hypothetical protein [Portunus trituberculatus]
MVFYKLKIRSKSTDIAEVDEEKVEGGFKTFWVAAKKAAHPSNINGPFPQKETLRLDWELPFFFILGEGGQAVTALLSCETQRETFSDITACFDDKFTISPELNQTRTGQTRTGPEHN